MYKFVLYGHQVRCNVDVLTLLQIPGHHTESKVIGNISLSVSFDYSENCKTDISHPIEYINEYECAIHLPGRIKYIIDARASSITVVAININEFLDTFLNLPFSLLFLMQNKLLLHSCAVTTSNGNVLAFSGIKGSGKSTLLSCLLVNGYGFFTDDTLLINNELSSQGKIMCYGALDFYKIDKFKVENKDKYYINRAKKAYVPVHGKLSSNFICGELKDLFFLTLRSNHIDFDCKITDNSKVKKLMICNAVIGYKAFCSELQDMVKSSNLLELLAHQLTVRLITLKSGLEFMDNNIARIMNCIR